MTRSTKAIQRAAFRGLALSAILVGCTINNADDDDSDGDAGSGANDEGGNSGSAGKSGSGGKGGSAGKGGVSGASGAPGGGGDGAAAAGVGGETAGAAGESGGAGGLSGGAGGQDGDAGGAAGDSQTEGGEGGITGEDAGAGQGGAAGDGGGSGGPAGPDVEPVEPDDGRAETGSLVMQVTAAQSPAIPGQRVAYTITIGNESDVAVEGVSVLMRLPVGLEFYYTNADPASTSCGNGYCSPSEEASWAVGSLPARSTVTITVSPTVLETVGSGDVVASLFRLSATGVNPATITKTTDVQSTPMAEFTFAASEDPVLPGQSIEFELDAGQIGDMPLAGAEIRARLPGGLVPTAISDGGTLVGGDIVWSVGAVPVGATVHRRVKATLTTGADGGEVLNPRATFTYTGGLATDHVAQVPISVMATRQPLSLMVTESMEPLVPGAVTRYRATVANTALRAIEDVVLTLRVPRELEYYYTTHSDPDSSSCGNGWCSGEELAAWSLGDLPAGTTTTIDLSPSLLATLAGDGTLVTGHFTLRGTGANAVNRFKTAPANGRPGAQLSLGTLVEPVTPGQSFSYDLQVGQVGATALAGAVLKAYLPPGLAVTSISDGGTASGSELTWSLGSVPVAGTLRRSVSVTVDDAAAAGTVLAARATLTYTGGMELDAASEHALSVVAAELPLSATLAVTPDPAVLGGRVLYTTTIKNESARAVDGVSLLLRVPTASEYYYTTHADPDSSSCGNGWCSASEEASWALGSLAAGETRIVTVNPEIAATLVGGSLVTMTQRLTATDLGGRINLQVTTPTRN